MHVGHPCLHHIIMPLHVHCIALQGWWQGEKAQHQHTLFHLACKYHCCWCMIAHRFVLGTCCYINHWWSTTRLLSTTAFLMHIWGTTVNELGQCIPKCCMMLIWLIAWMNTLQYPLLQVKLKPELNRLWLCFGSGISRPCLDAAMAAMNMTHMFGQSIFVIMVSSLLELACNAMLTDTIDVSIVNSCLLTQTCLVCNMLQPFNDRSLVNLKDS